MLRNINIKLYNVIYELSSNKTIVDEFLFIHFYLYTDERECVSIRYIRAVAYLNPCKLILYMNMKFILYILYMNSFEKIV